MIAENEPELWEAFLQTVATGDLIEMERVLEKIGENEIRLAREELEKARKADKK